MKVALVGNQNSGKTTLFNALTGSNQKVGNWPGVTVERKEGVIKGTEYKLIDLPGIYSMSPYTSEEEVSRKFVFEESPDVIVNIIDATSLERSLYLTTQLAELDCQVIVALNMQDMLRKKGLSIDDYNLSSSLGMPVVSVSALKGKGIDDLVCAIKEYDTANNYLENGNPFKTGTEVNSEFTNNSPRIFSPGIEEAIAGIENKIHTRHKRFTAVKLLERDLFFTALFDVSTERETAAVEKLEDRDIEQVIANARYDFIVKVKGACVKKTTVKESVTDRLDKIFLNKWAAIPIFAAIMLGVYVLSVGIIGSATVDLIGEGIGNLGNWFDGILKGWGASDWSRSLVTDGVIQGAGAVLGFVPQLIILFLCISLLETSGYMSRIALILDKLFRKFGLSGKSLIPFIVGSGCSVPAIMTCRTIENETEKRMTVMLTPFIPCSAKLPVIALFSGYFFDKYSGLVSASLYFLAIAVIVISALVMKKIFKSGKSAFVSELPEYKLPSPKYVLRDVYEKTWAFIRRAGTIILFCSVLIWFLSSFSWSFKYGVSIDKSILAGIGNAFAWFFYPMLGEWSWAASVSAIQGLVAKEQIISGMAVIAGLSDAQTGSIFAGGAFSFFSPASAYAFMVFNLFSAPCFGAIGAMRRELGSTKRMWQAIGFQTMIAWVLACVIFGLCSLIALI